MSSNCHRVLTPGASKKRKEREGLDASKASSQTAAPPLSAAAHGAEPELSNNRLLAGYLAHEFLTKGTLFGQKWDPARADAVAPTLGSAALRKPIRSTARMEAKPTPSKPQAYDDVARLLKTDGAHIPGIVNPTQLARWLQM
ncbi:hypothetical protein ACLOJK_011319 [Asimina triloba]